MKKILICFLATGISVACFSQQKVSTSSVTTQNNGKTEHSFTMTDDNGTLQYKYTGEIAVTEDEKGIASISEGGKLFYRNNKTKITVTSGDKGIQYEINGGDKKTTLTAEEKELVADCIKILISHGLGAKERAARMYKQGGTTAVLSEVKSLKTDYVKAIYLKTLVADQNLSTNELVTVLSTINTGIESDFEKAGLLKKIAPVCLKNAAIMEPYLAAVKNIGSDFEKAGALKSILSEPLSKENFTKVIQVAETVGSDFEKAGILKSVLQQNKISAGQFSEVLHATTAISSDFEKAGVLKSILKNGDISKGYFNETLATVSSINSDFEKAGLLKQVAGTGIKDEGQWLNLIGQAEKINSNFEKGNVLISIAGKMPANDAVRTAYMKAAKSIDSDFDYGRVVRSINQQPANVQ